MQPIRALTLRRRVAEWLILALATVAVGAALFYDLVQERALTHAVEKDRLNVQARVIGENIRQQLEGIDQALSSVQRGPRRDVSPHQTSSEHLAVLSESIAGMRNMLVLDRHAVVTASSNPALLGRRLPERDYFLQPARSRARDLLYVSPPFMGVLGHPVIVVSRVLLTPDGEFDGVVAASLDTRYFEVAAGAGLYADDMTVSLSHGGGSVFLTVPAQGGPSAARPVDALGAEHSGAEPPPDDPVEAEPRLSAIRAVSPPTLHMQHPLFIAASRSEVAIHAAWRRQATELGGFFAVLLVASTAGLRHGQSRRREVDRLAASAAEERRLGAERLALALEGGAVGLWDWDMQADRMQLDERTLRTLGRRREDLGDTGPAWRALWHPEDARTVLFAVERHARAESAAYQTEFRVRHQDGRWIWLGSRAQVVARDAAGVALRMAGTHTDITERKRVDTELQQLADRLTLLSVTDPLTRIGNRRGFDQALQSEWARAARRGDPVALLMLDVDHFKIYNDRYGHPAGDACLQRIAAMLGGMARREGELAARYGGEEFAVLIPGISLEGAQALAQRCLAALAALEIEHAGSPTSAWVTVSIGVASVTASPDGNPTSLVAAADTALYRAKASGRCRWMV